MSIAELMRPETPAEQERHAGYLELFFDLVFVFAVTQVTALALADPSAGGLARAALVLALVVALLVAVTLAESARLREIRRRLRDEAD